MNTYANSIVKLYELRNALNKLFNKTAPFKCQCANDNGMVSKLIYKSNAKAAAQEFAEKVDNLKNGYPFLNGMVRSVTVRDINSGEIFQFKIEMEKTYRYIPI